MKKTRLFGGLLALLFFAFTNLQAQHVGIGIGVASSGTLITNSTTQDVEINLSPTSIYLTFRSNVFRLEGEFGVLKSSVTDSKNDDIEASRTSYNIGLGAFFSKQNTSTELYIGARVGKIFHSEIYKYGTFDEEDERSDTFIAPTIGFEYIFESHFSIGGEVQLNYLIRGNVDKEDTSEFTVLRTRTIIFVRYYF